MRRGRREARNRRYILIVLPLLLLFAIAVNPPAISATPLDDAIRLQREGRNRDAQRALRELLPGLRASGDLAGLARALAAVTDASLALGEYEAAIQEAQEAHDVHQRLGQRADAAWDLNAIGLANLYLARYDNAVASYQRALALDRAGGDGDGEITRLNNIGNVYYMHGRYADALRLYEDAMAKVDTVTSDRSRARLRKATISNLAVLHQRLGGDQRALDMYSKLRSGETMQPSEEAQLLVNQGWLFRRLGDPVKAMETYRQAQALFARGQHRDGGDRRLAQHRHRLRPGPERLRASPRRVRGCAETGPRIVEPERRSAGPSVSRRDASPDRAARRCGCRSRGCSRRRHTGGARRRTVEGALRPRADDRRPGPQSGCPAVLRAGPYRHRIGSRRSSGRCSQVGVSGGQTRRLRRPDRVAAPRPVCLGGGRIRAHRTKPRAYVAGSSPAERPAGLARRRAAEDCPGRNAPRVLERRARLGAAVGFQLRLGHCQAGIEPRRCRQRAASGRRGVARWRRLAGGVGRRGACPALRFARPDGCEPPARRSRRSAARHPVRGSHHPQLRQSARRAVRRQLSAVGSVSRPPERAARPPMAVAMAAHAGGLRRSGARVRRPIDGRRGAAGFVLRR